MVDLNVAEEKEKDKEKDKSESKEGGGSGGKSKVGGVGESSKLKRFMGKTPGILKTKLLTVLGNSNEIINGISNKNS
uniref:Uncharacterized protein n=1 Tax=Megaselia scalaris TaxID=36166 RepID=T1GKJ7_MEGSC